MAAMVPRRPGQFLEERLRRHFLIVVVGTASCVAIGLLGIRWWPLALVAIILSLVGYRAGSRSRRLDPANDLKGLDGERRVGVLLESLAPHGFLSLHDVDLGHGNVDHVAIGPTGVYAIEVKNWTGRLYPKGSRLMHGKIQADDVVKQTMNGALRVHDALKREGEDAWVTPILVSTKATVWEHGFSVRNVRVLPIERLEEVLRSGAPKFDRSTAAHLRAALVRGGAPLSVRNISS